MIRLITCLFLIFYIGKAEAQVKNLIKGNPFAFSYGILHAEYEKPLDSRKSLSIGAILYPFTDERTYGAWSVFRFYLTHKKKTIPAGFYLGPDVGLFFYHRDVYPVFGVMVGYQWLWESGFVLDLGIGPQYIQGEEDSNPYPFPQISIGYAW